MNASSWQTVGVIFGVIFGCATVYYMRSASAAAAAQLRQKAIDDATAPLREALDRRDAFIAALQARITVLEDRLYSRGDGK